MSHLGGGGGLGRVNGFVLLKFLGKGTFGAVYQARREEDSKIYAIKKVDTRRMNQKDRAEAVNEIRVLASVAGPHVITFYEAFVEQDVLYIVTEFATHGDLFAYLKNARRKGNLSESTVWTLFLQMCLGVQTLHNKNILHRDLKGANVFMCSSNYVKLGDLGVSKVLKHQDALARTQVGTPYYVAPEVWRNRPYNSKCDMWSLGCLLYELCTFKPPFEAQSMEGLARCIMKGKYDPIPSGYSQGLQDVLARLLVVDPARRASCDDILALPAVQQRLSSLPPPPSSVDTVTSQDVDLVGTIAVPRRFNDLHKNLPPSRYDTPLSTPAVGAAALVGRAPQPAYGRAEPEVNTLNPVTESPEGEVAAWRKQGEQRKQAPGQPTAAHTRAQPRSVAPRPGAGKPPTTPSSSVMANGQRQRVAATPSALRLPHVPGAQPKGYGVVAPSEIKVVYHNPHGAVPYSSRIAHHNSKVSIFRGGGTPGSAYNPITHTNSQYAIPGSNYHNRYVAQPQQSRLARLHSGSSIHSVQQPPGARHRVAQPRYY